jgi:hypothetical protein
MMRSFSVERITYLGQTIFESNCIEAFQIIKKHKEGKQGVIGFACDDLKI